MKTSILRAVAETPGSLKRGTAVTILSIPGPISPTSPMIKDP